MKPRFSLIPSYPMTEVANVFTFGASKYGDRDWESGIKWSERLDSLERHLNAFKGGENLDTESGLNHLAHICSNALMILEYTKTHTELDDRPKRQSRSRSHSRSKGSTIKHKYLQASEQYKSSGEHLKSILFLILYDKTKLKLNEYNLTPQELEIVQSVLNNNIKYDGSDLTIRSVLELINDKHSTKE